MAGGRLIGILRNREGKPEHMIVHPGVSSPKCYCSSRIRVVRNKVYYVSFKTKLACSVCEQERQRWDSWWEKVEADEREAERQKHEQEEV